MSIQKPIRLFWGENYSQKPDVVSRAIDNAYHDTLDKIALYPGELYEEVLGLLAKHFNLKEENILLGHGIEGLIHLTSTTFLDATKTVGIFEPSFFVFNNNATRYKNFAYPCAVGQKVDVNDFIEKLQQTDLFYIASPNTATGNYLLSRQELELVLQSYKGILVVDECYFGIGEQSVLDLVTTYSNLIVYRGLTKVQGLGSLRLGMVFSSEENIKKLNFHHRIIELDPINAFSLNVLKYTLPYFDLLAENTVSFFQRFFNHLQKSFPLDTFTQNVTTFEFMDISRYKTSYNKIAAYMKEQGYILESGNTDDTTDSAAPGMLELTPPPEEYWEDFVMSLKKILEQSN